MKESRGDERRRAVGGRSFGYAASPIFVAGVIRDASGNYAASLWVMASLDLLSAGLWILMPAAQARDARR